MIRPFLDLLPSYPVYKFLYLVPVICLQENAFGFNIYLESLFGKGTPGAALQVSLKIDGFLPVSESNRSFYMPGFIFRSMRDVPGIMRLQAGIKVLRKTDIESFLIDL